jgi:hypothetical protein
MHSLIFFRLFGPSVVRTKYEGKMIACFEMKHFGREFGG